MENGIPEGVRSDIRAAVAPILESARKAGWFLGVIIHTRSSRGVEFNAVSPSGRFVHAAWGENVFAERLKALIDSH
jgi:hypothetical protein